MTKPEDILDPDAPISEEETAAAEALRLALEDPARASDEAALLRAASLAHAPRDIDPAEHRAIVERALRVQAKPAKRGGVVVRVAFGSVAAVVALAAGVLLFVRTEAGAPAPSASNVPLVHVRSTQPLFDAPFAATGGTSARIDRIAVARATDLRDNQFSRWGVK